MYDYGYGYDYGYTDYDAAAGILGGMAIFAIIFLLIVLAVWIINLVALWKIYKKAGKKGWETLIPFYNQWVLFEISGLNWWWFLIFMAPVLLSFIPLVNAIGGLASLFAMFNCYYNLSKKFNKDTGFAICLTLFSPICIPILGLSKKNVYNNNVTVSNNGVFENSGNNNNAANNNGNYNNNNVVYQNNVPNNNFNNPSVQPNNVNYTVTPVVPVAPVDNNIQQPAADTPVVNSGEQGFSFCGNCGTQLSADTQFCPNCGQKKM